MTASGLANAQILENGSFEQGYAGWTTTSGDGVDTLWVSVSSGDAIDSRQLDILDQADNVTGPAFCIAAFDERPLLATDGSFLALSLSTTNSVHRLYQDVELPADALSLTWDMSYDNGTGQFLDESQEITFNVRDPETDQIVAELYATAQDVDPGQVLTMSAYSADLSAFAGQRVRVDLTLFSDDDCFPTLLDNFQITRSCGDGIVQGTDECDDGPEGSETCNADCTRLGDPEESSVESGAEETTADEREGETSGCQGAGGGSAFALSLLLGTLWYRRWCPVRGG